VKKATPENGFPLTVDPGGGSVIVAVGEVEVELGGRVVVVRVLGGRVDELEGVEVD
jgi:hypothetical protein